MDVEQILEPFKALVSSSVKNYPTNVKMLHKQQLLESAPALALFPLESHPANKVDLEPPSQLSLARPQRERELVSIFKSHFLFPPGFLCLSHCIDPQSHSRHCSGVV